MGKKSAAKIRRNQKRAEARGEAYEYTAPTTKVDADDEEKKDAKLKAAKKLKESLSEIESNSELNSKERRSAKRKAEAIASEESGVDVTASDLLEWYEKEGNVSAGVSSNSKEKKKVDNVKLNAVTKLKDELSRIESDTGMNAKERRSAKKRAEAIALEESGCKAADLLSWYEEAKEQGLLPEATKNNSNKKRKAGDATPETTKKDPYILFVGQLSYTTTKDQLFQHFQKELGKEHVTPETLSIRLLTDPKKNNKSRGMAFVETTDPELLYSCLKLHHTHLDGRRINVERSAGGGKGSEARQNKIKRYRTEQQEYLSETVDKILEDYKSQGDLNESELDEGVISLCKRHSPHVVSAALTEYVEARGGHMENPSAYLTHIIGRIAVEGQDSSYQNKSSRPKQSRDGADHKSNESENKSSSTGDDNALKQNSEFTKTGVDMSVSSGGKGRDSNRKRVTEMSQLFPSMNNRGRGRGRGYMR